MALMRMGRKGDDPKKKKDGVQSVGEVTVTSKRASTWNDVDYNEQAKKTNAESASTYDKQLKYYNEQSKSGKKDMKTMFSGGGRYLNPDELKRWNSENSSNYAERAGLEAEKIYVPKGFKYGDATTNKGALNTSGGQGYQGAGPVYHEFLKKPIKKSEVIELKINKDDLPISNLPIKKAMVTQKTGKLATLPEKESPEFTEPSGTRIKTRYIKPKNVSMGEHVASNVKYVAKKALGGVPFLRSGVEKKREALIQGKAGREIKLGKAYFGEFEGSTKSEISNVRKDLKDTKKQMRSAIGDVKKGTAISSPLSKSERIKGYRDEIKAASSGIRTANKASKYLGKLGQQSANSAVTEYKTSAGDIKSIGTGKIRIATPGKFQGYADFARSKKKK
jgi:hypothetical protein